MESQLLPCQCLAPLKPHIKKEREHSLGFFSQCSFYKLSKSDPKGAIKHQQTFLRSNFVGENFALGLICKTFTFILFQLRFYADSQLFPAPGCVLRCFYYNFGIKSLVHMWSCSRCTCNMLVKSYHAWFGLNCQSSCLFYCY